MKTTSSYDSALNMFIQAPREADPSRLRFLRWLGEHDKLEHAVAGPSGGPYAAKPAESTEATVALVT
jgi:hypothetical protein